MTEHPSPFDPDHWSGSHNGAIDALRDGIVSRGVLIDVPRVKAQARVGALGFGPPHERVLECFALPDRSHRHEMEIECSSHDASSRCVKFGEPCALWTLSVRNRTTRTKQGRGSKRPEAGPEDAT